jgi:hypothetical protein
VAHVPDGIKISIEYGNDQIAMAEAGQIGVTPSGVPYASFTRNPQATQVIVDIAYPAPWQQGDWWVHLTGTQPVVGLVLATFDYTKDPAEADHLVDHLRRQFPATVTQALSPAPGVVVAVYPVPGGPGPGWTLTVGSGD